MQAKQWKDFLSKNASLLPAYDRLIKEGDAPTPFCLKLGTIDGIDAVKSRENSPDYQLRVSLFDAAYKQFFGRSWTGPVMAAKPSGQKRKISVNENVYWSTSVKDTSILIVIELLSVVNHQSETERCCAGWTFIRPFASDDVPDIGGKHQPPTKRMDVFAGTSRGLLHMEEPLEKFGSLQKVPGLSLACCLMTNVAFLKVQHLLPENIVVGVNDVVPGVAEAPSRDPFKRPRLLKPVRAYLDNITVNLYPNIDKFEEELVSLLNEDRLNRDNIVADGSSVSISERRLLIGVHNGYCYVEKPEVAHLVPQELSQRRGSSMRKQQRASSHTSLNSASLGTTYVLRDRAPVNGLVQDPLFTIVFTLQYMVTEPISKSSNQLSMSMNKTQSFPVSVRWTGWSPFSRPRTPGEQTKVSFLGGPHCSPDQVFTYKMPKFDMESATAIKEMTGTLNFSFIDGKAGTEGQRGNNSLSVGYQQSGDFRSDTSAYTESVLQPAGLVVDKPPRSAPTTPRASLQRQSLPLQPSPLSSERQTDNSTVSPGIPAEVPHTGSPSFPRNVMGSPSMQMYSATGPTGPAMSAQQQVVQHNGHIMSLPPPPASYPVGPVGYPMEIRNVSTPGITAVGAGDGELEELPFTPVHATIMAVPSGTNTGSRLSRAAYAKLYAANFPPILDRHKQDAEVVNPNDYINFVMAREESDDLQCNEIILQFLAFSRLSAAGAEVSNHSTVFFTFQFYKFPQITTERLLLGQPEQNLTSYKAAQPCILRRLAPDGKMKEGAAGYQVKYVVDPTHMKPGEGSLFVRHLSQQTLHIDVWDGDSLLLVGSAAVELKHLCRQGREGVQVSYELDIMASEVSEDRGHSFTGDVTRGGSVRAIGVHASFRGKLHLRLANIGHPVDAKSLPSKRSLALTEKTSVVRPDRGAMQGSFTGGSLSNIQNTSEIHRRAAKASHLTHTNTELSSLLHSRSHATAEQEGAMKQSRKIARMMALRESTNQQTNEGSDENRAVQSLMSFKHQKAERARDLKIMEAYRSQCKDDGIKNMLNQAITTEHTVHPSMGTVAFFEYQLTNPGNTEVTVSIRPDCQQITVVTDSREWRHFKQLNKLNTPIEEGMFNTDATQSDPQLFLRPKETVYIPIKYVSFEADHSCPVESPGSVHQHPSLKNKTAAGLNKTLSTRLHRIYFTVLGSNKLLAILALKVEPEPHIIDQTFRFHQPEHSFLKKSIRLPPFQSMINGLVSTSGYQQLLVRCSDETVVCESYRRQHGEPQDVFIKAAVGASPQQKKFFVCIYSDQFMSKPDQIWQFYTHALQRVDVSCVQGQTTRVNLILRGTQSSRMVKCFTSHPSQMHVSPSDPFLLAAGAIHELYLEVKPTQSGSKFFYLNVVDIECHQLVRNWLICVTCSAPVISKTFELHLPAGGGKGSNKRISFTNPYSLPKTFSLTNNRNDLLQFKETRLDMHPKETRIIGLRFMPSQNTGSAEIMIFINDEEDKNEETFCVKANYILEEEDN